LLQHHQIIDMIICKNLTQAKTNLFKIEMRMPQTFYWAYYCLNKWTLVNQILFYSMIIY